MLSSGRTRFLGMIGHPAEHGLRPRMHNTASTADGSIEAGRVGIYELMAVTDNIRTVRLRNDGLLMASVGMTTVEEVLRTVV